MVDAAVAGGATVAGSERAVKEAATAQVEEVQVALEAAAARSKELEDCRGLEAGEAGVRTKDRREKFDSLFQKM